MQLSAQAQNELAVYKQTQTIDTTGELYNEAYEWLANDMSERTRNSDILQYKYVMRRIAKL